MFLLLLFFFPPERDDSIICNQFIFVWLQNCVMSSPPDLVMEFDSLLLIVFDTNLVLSSKSFSKFIFIFILSSGIDSLVLIIFCNDIEFISHTTLINFFTIFL